MSYKFCLFLNFFVPKTYFLKVLDGTLLFWTLWVLLLELPNQKMTSITLNTSFHIDLGKFVNDWRCVIQRLK
jgi:hypothetical protein